MTTDLHHHIQNTKLIDTHEHLYKEAEWVEGGPDVLADLFWHYIAEDLISAGASPEAVARAKDASDPDIEARWQGIRAAWDACQYTGYGMATRWMAKNIYGMEDITLAAIEAAADINARIRQPGGRLKLLRETANLDHVQVDDFLWACEPDQSGVDFFLYDLSWWGFCRGNLELEKLHHETGITVTSLADLREGMTALFARYGQNAIAVKMQHAYERTLAWQPRTDSETEAILQRYLRGSELSTAEMLCLGDWCWSRGVELAVEYNLPVKLHTGYLAGNERMFNLDGTRAAHLSPLIQHYSDARFVLMHTTWPYVGESLALAKHHPNVYLDLCWAWSINPHDTEQFIRRALHSVPVNKLFMFGGDTFWPTASVAFAAQARAGFERALQAEVDDGFITEGEAIAVATRMMDGNQRAVFDIDGTLRK